MLATPGALADTGLLLGMVLIAFCGFTSAFGLYLLTRCAARTGTRRNSFYSIALETLPRGARWFDLAIALKVSSASKLCGGKQEKWKQGEDGNETVI